RLLLRINGGLLVLKALHRKFRDLNCALDNTLKIAGETADSCKVKRTAQVGCACSAVVAARRHGTGGAHTALIVKTGWFLEVSPGTIRKFAPPLPVPLPLSALLLLPGGTVPVVPILL